MKNQMINTKEGAPARVNNLSYAMQLAELDSQMEQDYVAEAMYIEDLVYEEEPVYF